MILKGELPGQRIWENTKNMTKKSTPTVGT